MTSRIGCALALLAAGVTNAPAQSIGTPRPSLLIRSVEGRDLFRFYCASCHGREGAGDGPVAAQLKSPPPDLRRLAARNGGAFPRARVEAFVTHGAGATPPSHGTPEMPAWGPIFLSLDPSDTMTAIRITNLVRYIETIQAQD